jgi:hypothetical protein
MLTTTQREQLRTEIKVFIRELVIELRPTFGSAQSESEALVAIAEIIKAYVQVAM